MAKFEYSEIFLFVLGAIFLIYVMIVRNRKRSSSMPTHWPVVGMLPGILQNAHQIHEYITKVVTECGGSFKFKGPVFANIDMLFTSDPANVHHVFSRNFANYPKGPEFRKIFEILGDGIFNADFESWEFHRKITLSAISNSHFYGMLERAVWEKVENGLIPVLNHFAEQGGDIDLQDIFQRLTFDSICKLLLDSDPNTLRIDLPYVPCEKAFSDITEALLYRHFLPETIWKMQRWLKIGKEKRLIEAWKAFDEFIYPRVFVKEGSSQKDDSSLLATFRKAYDGKSGLHSSNLKEFLRDTTLNLMFAGRDTTSTSLTWFFWLLASNPSAKIKILEEIEAKLNFEKDEKQRLYFNVEESRKLVYLHGALCESLRLFPPVGFEHKAPVRPDTLPSGHYLQPDSKVIFSFYSMGRTETIWGKDCLEFKPERWISASGGVNHEPSFKFPAFNAGPRTCVGKEMAFIQMKMIAVTILYHYDVQLVEGQRVVPRDSVVLQSKHGLRVRVSKRKKCLMNEAAFALV